MESKIVFVVLSDFADKTLEWQLADQQFGRFLVAANFTQSNGSWAVTVRLLDASSGWRRLTRSLGGELLSRRLAAGGFAGSLLGTGHVGLVFIARKSALFSPQSHIEKVAL